MTFDNLFAYYQGKLVFTIRCFQKQYTLHIEK